MRILQVIAFSSLLMGLAVTSAFAAPTNNNKADNNPQVVAYYTSGTHGIVGENATHTGTDLVMQAGQSGNFQQWFTGNSTQSSNPTEGDHSVWLWVGQATSCDSGWNLVVNANASWGSYLQPGNYCVHTNDFHN